MLRHGCNTNIRVETSMDHTAETLRAFLGAVPHEKVMARAERPVRNALHRA